MQIEQLEAKARLKNEMQERVLKETMRLEKEEREKQWDRKHKEQGMKPEKEI